MIQKGASIVEFFEKTCGICGASKRIYPSDKKKSEYTTKGAYWRDVCKECDNVKRRARRSFTRHIKGPKKPTRVGRKPLLQDSIHVKWCPREEWPSNHYFNRGEFSTMLQDGVCTPGMMVDYDRNSYIIWGARGGEQGMQEL